MKYIDIHPHIIADDTKRYPLAPLGGHQSDWSRTRPVTAEQMIGAMDKAGASPKPPLFKHRLVTGTTTPTSLMQSRRILTALPAYFQPTCWLLTRRRRCATGSVAASRE